MISETISHYRILSKLGAGGMGEVYLAQDTKLDRKVALKILPAEVAAHPDRMRRFVQEAKAASALNHPNIITIHEIDETDSGHFIATEFIDGETLRECESNAPLKLTESLDIATQIASALAAAHAAGIVHRDIKPENVMLRHDGIVKVLDFGLAKLTERAAPESVDGEASTRPAFNTDPGVVMGTAIYMSPEQARGLAVDARTDVFSLGIVLYEMVAGRRPFDGSNRNEIMASVLSDKEPQPLTRYSSEVPTELGRIISKALRKEREQRYQTTKDLLLDLQSLKQQLDFEAKLERSLTPETRDGQTVSGAPATASGQAAQTTPITESLANRAKHHKRSLIIALSVLIVAVATLIYLFYFARPASAIDSIAVLPLANASNDPNTEYLSDGITESIINTLSQLPNFKVMARTTVFRYKGKETNAQKVGKELGVEAVLTGKVLQRGDTLVIQADLVRVSDGSQLWGEQYTRKMSDIFAVQGEIAQAISEKLRLRLTGAERDRLTKPPTENTEAYQLYLRGYHSLYKFTAEGSKKSLDYFRQAIEKDPNYAPAYVGLAEAYVGSAEASPTELGPKAKEAARRAISIDPSLADAHYALALVSFNYEFDWPTAEREFKRAIELKPGYVLAHDWYGYCLAEVGRFDEAYAELKQALELDPLSVAINSDLGSYFYWSRQFDKAIEQLQKTLELDHEARPPRVFLILSYAQKSQFVEALNQAQKLKETIAYVDALAGQRKEAQGLLDELKTRSKTEYIPPDAFALIYTGLGEKDLAFEWWRKSCEIRSSQMLAAIKVDPMFDPLRSDPRFPDLVRCVGLSP